MRCILCGLALLGALAFGSAQSIGGDDKTPGKDKGKKEGDKRPAPATVEVRLPASAELFFDGAPTRQRGETRLFFTPPLEPGYNYAYQLSARWVTPDGKEQKDERQITVRAGKTTKVDLLPKKKEKDKDKEKDKEKDKDKKKAGKFLSSDLKGWEGLTEYWSFKDGVLTGATPKGLKFNTFLCSKKKYKDFELHLEVKLTGKGANSGIQIRSEISDAKKFAVRGPQCDMGGGYWGSLYGEDFGGMMKAAPKEVVEKALKSDDFNDYYIKCVGKHVTIKLNGAVTVDDDFDKMPDEGIIAFQLHAGGPMEAIFRNVRFKEVKAGR